VKTYLHNLKRWLLGFAWADGITFKPGWSADWRWYLLNHFDAQHGAEAGPALWGTTDSPKAVRLCMTLLWIVFISWVVWVVSDGGL
jgi:hypothetical protein